MSDLQDEVSRLLDEKPELEDDLRAVLKVDESKKSWTFDDIPLDSGSFGEIVSREIAVKVDDGDGYTLADPEAVRRGFGDLEDGQTEAGQGGDRRELDFEFGGYVPTVDSSQVRMAGYILGALGVVFLFRTVFMYPSVFRDGHVVLAGNDPYGFRYWVDQLLASDLRAFDTGALANLPEEIVTDDILLFVVLWWVSALLGGSQATVGQVLAWYPVISALITALIAYALTVEATGDRRAGLAAILMLAIVPSHGYRTALGFADHHAFDYLWLGVTVLGIAWSIRDESVGSPFERTYWADARFLGGIALIGVGMAAQVAAWPGGPILLIPAGLYVAVQTLADVRARTSPIESSLGMLLGTGLGSVLAWGLHTQFGWMETFRWLAPSLLFGGMVGVVTVAEVAARLQVRPIVAAGSEIVIGAGLFGGALLFMPQLSKFLREGLGYFQRTGQTDIAETVSLVSGKLGTIVGPLLLLGGGFVLALAVGAIYSWRGYREHWPRRLPLVVYFWYLLGWSFVQIRFAGELSLFVACLGGIGFLWLASWVDLLNGSTPFDRSSIPVSAITIPSFRTLGSLIALFMLIGAFGIVQTPVKQSQLAIDHDRYQAAAHAAAYSEQWNLEYPNNYVLSPWGHNRMYNYFVNGESKTYGPAINHYPSVFKTTSSAEWYQQYQGQVGFVVVTKAGNDIPADIVYTGLVDRMGSYRNGYSGFAHFRAVYIAPDGSPKVFALVEGATIKGCAQPNTTITVSEDVTVSGTTFTYRRQVTTNETGWYSVTVPYPGQYGNVTVSSQAVQSGAVVGAGKNGSC